MTKKDKKAVKRRLDGSKGVGSELGILEIEWIEWMEMQGSGVLVAKPAPGNPPHKERNNALKSSSAIGKSHQQPCLRHTREHFFLTPRPHSCLRTNMKHVSYLIPSIPLFLFCARSSI
jgi:hypothetical protein